MAQEAIIKVKQAEEKAENIIVNARKSAQQMIKEAEQLAEETYREIISQAKTEAQNIFDQAKEEGEQTARPILEQGKKEAANIRHIDEKQLLTAVENIVERIVNTDGDR